MGVYDGGEVADGQVEYANKAVEAAG